MPKPCLPVLTLLALSLFACAGRPNSGALSQPTSALPTAQRTTDDAVQVASNFLSAWTTNRYTDMYDLLTANSRGRYSLGEFEALYPDAESTMTIQPGGKSFSITSALRQGDVTEFAYDMTFRTRTFGEFTDAARILTVVSTADGWRTAWSPADLFLEMKAGATLVVRESLPTRANIYDRDGEVIVDENGLAVRVTLYTKSYPDQDPESCFRELARVFKSRSADQLKTLYGDKTGRDYAYEVGDLSQEHLAREQDQLERVCQLGYAAVPTRRYIAGGLAPHVVGYVGRIPAEQAESWKAQGYARDALVGIDGVERYWEATLAGRSSAVLILQSPSGTTRTLARREARSSQSIYLTLDRKLQLAIQDMFKDAYANAVWGKSSTGAAAIVMDVHTGEILATASYPDFTVDAFNPNTSLTNAPALIEAWMNDPKKPTFNRAALGQYPLGSVFKIVSMAAAADSGAFKLTTTYNCTGVWNGERLGDRTRRDWLQGGHGLITLKQALIGSADTYFWWVGWTLNNRNPTLLVDYAKRMGFGGPTGVADISEATGALPDPPTYEQRTGRTWRGSDALNLVIGQGDVLVTPLQVVRMVAAVANGGTLYQPLLVKKVGVIGQTTDVATPIPNGKFDLKPEVLAGIQDAMCSVTTNPTLGTATFVFKGLKDIVVCGKTSTAQAGREDDEPHAWFAVYAGKKGSTPHIAIVVVVEHSGEGSYVAAPIVRRIVETYYGLPITPWPDWWRRGMPTLGSGD